MSLDQTLFRQALGRFATGICVITTNVEGQEPIGMTVNSFASVSLDPAMVLWSLQKNSDCFECFDKTKNYGINILAHDQESISNQYAKKDGHQLTPGSYRIGRSGCPVLKHAITTFECKVSERFEGGDHIILLAEVLDVVEKPSGKPLIFYAGQYRELK